MNQRRTEYLFSDAICGFFEVPTDCIRPLLNSRVQPLEPHHGTSLLAVSAFDFTGSEVGSYGEITFSVVVAPWFRPGYRLPKAALFPFQVATTTTASREHAIERWHLPHWMNDVSMEWERHDGVTTARASHQGRPIVELTVTQHSWSPAIVPFQMYSSDTKGTYFADMEFDGVHCEHEDERGNVVLHKHPLLRDWDFDDVTPTPSREFWMRNGVQSFEPLVTLHAGG